MRADIMAAIDEQLRMAGIWAVKFVKVVLSCMIFSSSNKEDDMKLRLLLGIAVIMFLAACAANSELLRERNAVLLNGAKAGDIDDVRDALLAGAKINAKDDSGDTALMQASLLGYVEIAELLINKGADVNTRDYSGDTPLSYAAHRGHVRIVELLLKNGAKVNTKDIKGITPLERAARKGHKEIIEFLKSHGARE